MKINTKEEYDKIPDGTLLKVFLEGDEWNDDCGEVSTVIKIGDKLYEYKPGGYYLFNERNEIGYEISIVKPSPNKSREPF